MKNSFISYSYKDSLLMAVPAVHLRSAFAKEVHRICRNRKLRPEAIVVELSHSAVVELIGFLKFLKQGSKKKEMLRCMFGLMVRNKFIHPDYYKKALILQEFYKTPLADLPDKVLAERLNYSKWLTIYLSPADSIIEAIRCAIELDIPVYGVDLQGYAQGNSKESFRFEDPHQAKSDLTGYEERVLKYCGSVRDTAIDLNREIYMVSGLKHCLTTHKKVLFTCGMAHWKSIVALMDDLKILPQAVHEIAAESEFRRVIIHPAMAARVMDVLPQMTLYYEIERYPVSARKEKNNHYNAYDQIRECLNNTYEEYTSNENGESDANSGSSKWSDIGIFEQYLFNLASVKQRKTPDADIMLSAADALMDQDFCRLLTEEIMDVVPEWASHRDYPDLPIVSPPNENAHKSGKGSANQKVKFKDKDKEEEFYTATPEKDSNKTSQINKYWKWDHDESKPEKHENYYGNWIWPPCESLIYGIAFKAAEISNFNKIKYNNSIPFCGSLEAGVDVKSTIKSYINGRNRVYVTKTQTREERCIIDGTNPDPFVFLFSDSIDTTRVLWDFSQAGLDVALYIKDQDNFKKKVPDRKSIFVTSISIEEPVEVPDTYKQLSISIKKKHGTVMFGNPCINVKQSAIWLEETDFKSCPIVRYMNFSDVQEYYKDKLCMNINYDEWQEALIEMAIPFAKKMVTIVASDSYIIPPRLKMLALQKKISLNLVGFSNFPEKQIEEARSSFSVPTLNGDGIDFHPDAETILGQSKDTYFETLPYNIRKQVANFNKKI